MSTFNLEECQQLRARAMEQGTPIVVVPEGNTDANCQGQPANFTEFFRVYGVNGYSASLAGLNTATRNYGPRFFRLPVTEGWGFEPQGEDDWDVCWATADALRSVLLHKQQLVDACRAMLLEVNSTGFLNRGEACLQQIEELLEVA